MKIRLLVLAAVVAAFAAAPIQPAGAAVTIGSNLGGSADDAFGCANVCTLVHSQIAGQVAEAPTDGVIVRWRIKTDSPGGPFALQVAKQAPGDSRIGGAISAQVTTAGAGIAEFPTRLSVKAGDNIGLWFTSANTAKFSPDGSDPGTTTLMFIPAITQDQLQAPTFVSADSEFLVNADLEPDIDGDGFGDETQDRCIGLAGGISGCPTVDPKLKLVAKWRQRYDRVTFKIASDRTVTFSVRGRLVARVGGKLRTFKPRAIHATLFEGQELTYKSEFGRSHKSQIKRLLKAKRKLYLTISFKGHGNGGGASTIERKIRLKL